MDELGGRRAPLSEIGQNFQRHSSQQTGQLWPLTNGGIRVVDLRRQSPWDVENNPDPNHDPTDLNGVWRWAPGRWTRITTDEEYFNWTCGWSGKTTTYRSSLNGPLHTTSPVNDETLWWVDLQFAYRTDNGGNRFDQQFTAPVGSPVSYVSSGIDNAVPATLAPSSIQAGVMYAGYLIWAAGSQRARTPRNQRGLIVTVPNQRPTLTPTSLWNGFWKGYGGNVTAIAPDPSLPGVLWAVHSPINGSPGPYKVGKSSQ